MACSVVQIVRSVSQATNTLWRTLSPSDFKRCDDGELWYAVGNSAVIFKAEIEGRWCSLKCYASSSSYRGEIYGERLYRDELFIFMSGGRGEWRDVVVQDWVEGVTLACCIEQCVESGDSQRLASIAQNFDKMALRMLESDWAHGDITCENIIVNRCDELSLIDLDASFVPSLSGRPSVEVGTAAFQHPMRGVSDFNRDIDDFSLGLISVGISALSLDVALYERYRLDEGLMLRPAEVVRGQSAALDQFKELFARHGEFAKYRMSNLLEWSMLAIPALYELFRWSVEGCVGREASTLFVRDCAWGYLDKQGREVMPPMFNEGFDFKDRYAAVQIGPYWHYIYSDGAVALNCSGYESIRNACNGVARVCDKGEWREVSLPQR